MSDESAPARALLAAILLQAIRDAQRGDTRAAAWLASAGAAWADLAFDIQPERFAQWLKTPRDLLRGGLRYSRTGPRSDRPARREGLRMGVSVRTHYRDPRGFVLELTLSAETGAELLPGVDAALDRLMQRGCTPVDPFTEPTAAEVGRNLARAQLAKSTPGPGPGGRLFKD